MPNKRFSSFKKGGAKTGQRGPKHDTVGPIKTKNWPGIPGKTQPGDRSQGVKKMFDGLASKGV